MTKHELHARKRNRLEHYDYSSAGAYFLTICTKERKNYFWESVGATIGRPQDVPLSPYGKVVDEAIKNIPLIYPSIAVEHYVIMPDHVHLLLLYHGRAMPAPTADIDGRAMLAPTSDVDGRAMLAPTSDIDGRAMLAPTSDVDGRAMLAPTSDVDGRAMLAPTSDIDGRAMLAPTSNIDGRAMLAPTSNIDGRAMLAPTISRLVQQMKGYVTKQIGKPIWQKLFYDHVIRTREDFAEHMRYIEDNPLKWQQDGLCLP